MLRNILDPLAKLLGLISDRIRIVEMALMAHNVNISDLQIRGLNSQALINAIWERPS